MALTRLCSSGLEVWILVFGVEQVVHLGVDLIPTMKF